MLKTFAAAAAVLAVFVAPAVAQDLRGAAIVAALLDHPANELGLTPGARVSGQLAQGGSQMANIEAPGGTVYFLGVCDENCRDLDMIVRDPSGTEVGRDFGLDDVPMVVLERAVAGVYTVEMSMPGCDGRCHWGVGVFR